MTTFQTSLDIPATSEQLFAALSDPACLARWWGPAGFSNTIRCFEFRPGGRWSLVMHGPDGKDYPNENVFADIDEPQRVVIEHASPPHFKLTIALTPSATGTRVFWSQTFEDPAVARQLEPIVRPAQQQNLERWAAEVQRGATER